MEYRHPQKHRSDADGFRHVVKFLDLAFNQRPHVDPVAPYRELLVLVKVVHLVDHRIELRKLDFIRRGT